MELKEPLEFSELVDKLIEHGMTGVDKPEAEDMLRRVSYYRLSGYTMQFRKEPSDSDFVDGACDFENVCRIYEFDTKMRKILREYIETVEVFYRVVISHYYSLSRCKNPPHDQHYDRNNYYRKQYFDEVLKDFNNQKEHYYKDSLVTIHHQLTYSGKYPLWVMTEMLSFSNLSKLYGCMCDKEKDLIAGKVGTKKELLVNHLHCLSVLRNKCAHAGRLYNTVYNPPVRFSKTFLKKNPSIRNSALFAYILILVQRLPREETKTALIEEIDNLISKYKDDIDYAMIGFPQNYKEILMNHRH